MKDLEYKYKQFTLQLKEQFGDFYLRVYCKIDGREYERNYDLKDKITKVIMDDEYVYLNYDNDRKHYQIKFEYGSCLVIDTFTDGGEHIDIIGCHDFNDEV